MKTGAQLLVETILEQGIEMGFGVPGESYLAVLDAIHDTDFRFINARQEGGAAFMAEAYGKLTGKPGIAFVTRGPGATNAAIGVHTAMQNSTPMVLFVGADRNRHAGPRGVSGTRLPHRFRLDGEVGCGDRQR